jgi:arylsulfatase A-like enzyme
VYGLTPWFRDEPTLAKLTSLPEHFRKNGYHTLAAGKIFHGNYGFKAGGADWDAVGPAATGAPFPKKKLVNTPSKNRLVDWGTFPHKDSQKGDYKIAGWAAERLKDMPEDKPFFLAAGFFLPHVPCFATQEWMDMYPLETLILPEVRKDDRADTPRSSWWLHWKLPEPRLLYLEQEDEWKNLVRSYLACISFMDAQLGKVLDALEESGHAEDTVVVLWSDHGFHLGEKEITGKNTLWEESTRVPLIFAGPGSLKGVKCVQPVELLDVFPTLCDLAGLKKPEQLEGHSLVAQLENANAVREWPAITNHNPGNNSVRDLRWRYIRYVDGAEELYDLKNDPNEYDNLAGGVSYAEEISRLRKWIPAYQAPHAPRSAQRILEYKDGVPVWEGEVISLDEGIPEMGKKY